MEKIATDIYSFEKLRRAGYVYVDKTDILWRMIAPTVDKLRENLSSMVGGAARCAVESV